MLKSSSIYLSKKRNELSQIFDLLYKKYRRVFALCLLLQFITYSYFFTSLIFTNHTFPNSELFLYPSLKTQGEGRWLADIIIWLQGGSGVQPFQMVIATTLQSINGIFFALFLGIKKRIEVFLVAAFICLYPAFLDNYSFGIDHITFALADTFSLIGIIYYKRRSGDQIRAISLSICFFVLALASYQPKISLIAFLCICYLLTSFTNSHNKYLFSWKHLLLKFSSILSVFFGSCLIYFLSIKLTIVTNIGQRTHINTLTELTNELLSAYSSFVSYYTIDSDYLPLQLRFMPIVIIFIGCLTLIYRASRNHISLLPVVSILLLLIPISLRLSYIINSQTWEYVGRITFVNGYALLFFISSVLHIENLNKFIKFIIGLFLYYFIVIGTQESNAAAIKTVYDLNMINRISSRIESATPNLYKKKYALVVIGHYPSFDRSRYVKGNSKNAPHVASFAFESYRQIEILNYFFGRDILAYPTNDQMKRTIASVKDRQSYPASDSVYLIDDEIIVVLLENYTENSPKTWTYGQ